VPLETTPACRLTGQRKVNKESLQKMCHPNISDEEIVCSPKDDCS